MRWRQAPDVVALPDGDTENTEKPENWETRKIRRSRKIHVIVQVLLYSQLSIYYLRMDSFYNIILLKPSKDPLFNAFSFPHKKKKRIRGIDENLECFAFFFFSSHN